MQQMRFEADEGWLPVNTQGTFWRYRARGVAGVVAIARGEDGKRSYEATHNDSTGNDTTITTRVRRKAAWFAMHGTKKGFPVRPGYPRAPLPEPTSGTQDTPSTPQYDFEGIDYLNPASIMRAAAIGAEMLAVDPQGTVRAWADEAEAEARQSEGRFESESDAENDAYHSLPRE